MKLHRLRETGLNGFSYTLGLKRNLGEPWQILIEPTNICNFKCVYCPQSVPEEHFQNGKGFLSREDFARILAKISKPWKNKIVNLIRDGEPTLHPDIVEFVRIVSSHGHRPQFSTNMSRMTSELAAELIDAGIYLVKSDFSHDKEVYERLRVKAVWERTRAGILAFLEENAKRGYPVKFHLVEMGTFGRPEEEYPIHLAKLRDLLGSHADHVESYPTHFHNALGEAKEDLSQAELFKKSSYNLCHHPWLDLVINFKGEAVGCCRDLRSEYVLGNILECEDVERDIWNGPRMKELRDALLKKHPEQVEICNKCDIPYGSSYAGSGKMQKIVKFLFG
ncbi:MAG: radical SAM protein [Candidatus Sumerlaeia bacterium]|nr:radical SAM protein [Candidatus Sumerlaeia bacterium]